MAPSPEAKARKEALRAAELAYIADFQKRLVAARLRRRMTQPQVATYLGITLPAYKKYENRPTSAFPIFLLPPLCELLEEPLSYWFGGRSVVRFQRPHAVKNP